MIMSITHLNSANISQPNQYPNRDSVKRKVWHWFIETSPHACLKAAWWHCPNQNSVEMIILLTTHSYYFKMCVMVGYDFGSFCIRNNLIHALSSIALAYSIQIFSIIQLLITTVSFPFPAFLRCGLFHLLTQLLPASATLFSTPVLNQYTVL